MRIPYEELWRSTDCSTAKIIGINGNKIPFRAEPLDAGSIPGKPRSGRFVGVRTEA